MAETVKNCPYCEVRGFTPDTTQNLCINTDMKVYHCWKCGAKGRWKGKLLLSGKTSRKLDPAAFDLLGFDIETPESKVIFKYLLGRGLIPDEILKEVRWSPQMKLRAIFPVYVDGEIKVFNARAVRKDDKPKYVTAGSKEKYVYRFDLFDSWSTLTEGPLDAHSSPHGIATFGKGISEYQLRLIASKFSTVFVAYDPDAPKARHDTYYALKDAGVDTYLVYLPKGYDPNKLGLAEMTQRINNIRMMK